MKQVVKTVTVFLVSFILFFLISLKSAFADVVINEFVPNPGTGLAEWVEFYNTDSSTADLSDYFFDDDTSFDSDSGSSQKVALSGLLPSLQSCFWELSSYLNNNGDSPSLFKLDSATTDTYNYASSSAGLSYSRIPDGGAWQISQSPSKSSSKCIDLAPSPTPTPTSTPASTNTPTPTPTPIPTKTPTPIPVTVTMNSGSADILGESTESAFLLEEEATPIFEKAETPITKQTQILGENNFTKLMISAGIILISACGILAFRAYKQYRKKELEG